MVIFGEGETEKEYIEKLKELDCFSYIAFEFRLKEDGNFETYFKENLDNDYIFAIIDIDGMNKKSS